MFLRHKLQNAIIGEQRISTQHIFRQLIPPKLDYAHYWDNIEEREAESIVDMRMYESQ